jgi:hypothetical protein
MTGTVTAWVTSREEIGDPASGGATRIGLTQELCFEIWIESAFPGSRGARNVDFPGRERFSLAWGEKCRAPGSGG